MFILFVLSFRKRYISEFLPKMCRKHNFYNVRCLDQIFYELCVSMSVQTCCRSVYFLLFYIGNCGQEEALYRS